MINKDLEKQCGLYHPDIELEGSGNVDYGHNLASAILIQKEQEDLEKRSRLEGDIQFIEKVKKFNINVEDIFSQRNLKEQLIREYKGYSRLNGSGKSKINLEDCKDSRLGTSFQNIYYSALNKLRKL